MIDALLLTIGTLGVMVSLTVKCFKISSDKTRPE